MKKVIALVLALACILCFVGCVADSGYEDNSTIEQEQEIRCPDCGFFLGKRSEGYCPQCEKEVK